MARKKNYALNKVEPLSRIRELLTNGADKAGERAAFLYREGKEVKEVSYSRFYFHTVYIGNALAARGFIGGKHIACVGSNSYRWVCAFLSTLAGDNVFVPIDKELPEKDIIHVLSDSDSEVVFCDKKYEDIILANLDSLPDIKLIIGFNREASEGISVGIKTILEEGKELYKSGYTKYTESQSDENALKLLVYTSGTTGNAKGVMLSEHNLVSCVYYGLQVSTVFDRCLSVLPYHHTYEAVCGLLVSLHKRATICINESLRSVVANLQYYKPSYILLVPAFAELFYKRIWSAAEESGRAEKLKKGIAVSKKLRKAGIDMRKVIFKDIHETFGGRLKKIVCGGAPIRAEIGEFFDDIGINLVNGYGITECSPLVSANRDKFNDFSTTGVQLPCVEITIEDPDDAGNGEICVKGDTVMLGYYKNEAETDSVLIDGKFHTGDLGCINEKGQICINGRKKNLIVLRNGKNIYPEEIENYIMAIPYVKEVVVYALTDENGSESALCAEAYLNEDMVKDLKLKSPAESLKNDIVEALKALPSYKHIAKIVVRPIEFEKTTSQKIKRGLINLKDKASAAASAAVEAAKDVISASKKKR